LASAGSSVEPGSADSPPLEGQETETGMVAVNHGMMRIRAARLVGIGSLPIVVRCRDGRTRSGNVIVGTHQVVFDDIPAETP